MKLTQQQKILSVLQSLQSGDHHIPEEYIRHHRRATASVLIVGGGVAGTNAARIAFGMGADLTVLDRNLEALRDHARPTL
jgi:pyruvate/2-oxoglutarate dehydrogenase complex dihydrolipoamide dehydrogenase (E3) component